MNKKRSRIIKLLLLMMLLVAGATLKTATVDVQAATTGFVKKGHNTYYLKNGKKYKGLLKLNGKTYYLDQMTGILHFGWYKKSATEIRYFSKPNGEMVTGWIVSGKGTQRRYFDPSTGIMKQGWMNLKGKYYYFVKKNGCAVMNQFVTDKKTKIIRYFKSGTGEMATGWLKNTNGEVRYFDKKTGAMAQGFKQSGGKYYYFYKGTGIMATGWVNNKSKGYKYYFDPSTGVMAVGVQTIGGKTYTFSSNGILQSESGTYPQTTAPGSQRTIKNYLAGALLPVGKALYVWGGGWTDATRKGVSPEWLEWYNSQTSSYDYNNYRDLSAANRAKGLDCSGFVGWAAYQVMQTKSGVGYGYTVVASDVGSAYKSNGWGAVGNQTWLANHDYKFLPGDVGFNEGHVWIVLGQCKDKSLVIVHSTPQAGCQIAGTPTPSGNYSSEAIELAKKYMSRFPGYTKYHYNTSSGHYIKNGSYFRWNRTTLADPDGYTNMTADQILKDLFE